MFFHVEHILSNERYIGDALVQKRYTTAALPHKQKKNKGELPQYYITGSHPPIISREIYEQAQRLKESRFSETRRAPHTFTHRIQCPSCGRFYRHINSSGTSAWLSVSWWE